MVYFQIFDEIVNIMGNDYSGCRIKKDWGKPEHYRQIVKKTYEAGELNRKRFKEIVDDYLLDFMDHHVVFRDSRLKETAGSIGFKVRRFEDILYVISTDQEKNIKIGTQITELDNMPVKAAAEKFQRELLNQPNERQLWENIIIKCKSLTVIDENKTNKFYINRYPDKKKESKYECKKVNDNTILLTYNDFIDYQQSQELLAKHGEGISSSKNLIIDVRQNSGGYDMVFLNLLDYIFPENFSITDKYGALTNITERNYNNRMEMLSEFLKQNPDNEVLKKYIDELTINKNKGFTALEMDNSTYVVKGTREAKNVIVLTDRYCGSSGDNFAIIASHSPWVKLMGRPTYGVIDYSNVAEQKFKDGFSLFYPTSVYEGAMHGTGYDNIGVKPDIYIPWSPEHIEKDIDLEYAIEKVSHL